jgi:hypothetical protein
MYVHVPSSRRRSSGDEISHGQDRRRRERAVTTNDGDPLMTMEIPATARRTRLPKPHGIYPALPRANNSLGGRARIGTPGSHGDGSSGDGDGAAQ